MQEGGDGIEYFPIKAAEVADGKWTLLWSEDLKDIQEEGTEL